MTRETAQAGNRASRTEHYLQWWENSPEWNAETSAVDKRHNSSFSFGSCREPAAAVLAVASLRLLVGGAGYATIFAKRPRNERSRATCRALVTAAHAISFMRYLRRRSPFVSEGLHFGRCNTDQCAPGRRSQSAWPPSRRRRVFGHCDARELAPGDANRFAFGEITAWR